MGYPVSGVRCGVLVTKEPVAFALTSTYAHRGMSPIDSDDVLQQPTGLMHTTWLKHIPNGSLLALSSLRYETFMVAVSLSNSLERVLC